MKVGVVGAGTMGAGIAQAFIANEQYSVVLCDMSEELAQKGAARIAARLEKRVQKGKLEEAAKAAQLARLCAGGPEDMAECDLVVEAVVEDMDAKQALFQRLSSVCGKDTVFASNTSSMSLTQMAQGLDRAVVGMHFFNPAEVMKLVEVTAGANTPEALVQQVYDIAADIGKTPVRVQESAGFVVNRLLIPMINEAVCVLAEGVASAEDIDTAMQLGANHPMGPLALGDLVGLDTCLAIMEVLQAETGDDKYRPHPLMRKMVRAGRLGRKAGRGFFDYTK